MAKSTTKLIIIPEYKPLYAMRKCFGPPMGPLLKPCPTPIDIIGELIKQAPPQDLTVMEVVPLGGGKYSDPVQLHSNNYMLSYDEIKDGKVQDTPVKVENVPLSRRMMILPDKITPGKSPKVITHDLSDAAATKIDVEIVVPDGTAAPAESAVTADKEVANAPAVTEEPTEDTIVANGSIAEETTPEAEPVTVSETPVEKTSEAAPIEAEASVEDETAPVEEVSTDETAAPAEPAVAANEIIDPYAGMTRAERKAARRAEREAMGGGTAQK